MKTIAALFCLAIAAALAGACSSATSVDNSSCPGSSACSTPTCPAGCSPGQYSVGAVGTVGMFSFVWECDPDDPSQPADCPVCASCQ